MSMQIIELVIDEDADNVAVDAVSLVADPAIEVNWVALSKEKKYQFKTIDEKQKIISGPALIPNKQIYRKDDQMGEYYIYFSKSTVAKCNELFFKNYNQKNATFEHEYAVDGTTVIESWLVTDKENDKSNSLGFDLPLGTWFISMKIDNPEIWSAIMDGKVRGYSIEGHFADRLSMKKMSKDELILEKIKKILNESK